MRIEFIQNFIDFCRGKKKCHKITPDEIKRIHKNYKKNILKLSKKIYNQKKIKVGFLVVFDGVFTAKNLYQLMKNDDIFEPYIIVIPYIAKGDDYMSRQLTQTYELLKSKYDNVFLSYSEENKKFIDFSGNIDIACFCNPYDDATMEIYSMKYYAKKGKMPFYFTYGYSISKWSENMFNNLEYTLWWKYYVENQFTIDTLKQNSFNTNNFILSGYIKMDNLAYINKIQRERKKIIIAPHHTILAWENGVNLGTFLDFADFYLMLFSKYPDIDFVFRPHSLLPVTLERDDVWGKKKTDEYFNKLQSFPNVEYQQGGDYLESFVNSDALIHDCGSFMAEYLFTENPACYIIKDKQKTKENFNAFGLQCLEQHYQAFSEEDIINFIENTVLKNNDPMKKERQNFAENVLKINYPNVTTFILNDLRKAISCSKY